MRLIGILSWFDENPAWLAAVITSFQKAQVSHVVAVDGRYVLYPDVRCQSDALQHEVITEACRGAGMGLTLHVPSEPWFGNETEKRTFCFDLAAEVAKPWDDWYFVLDADTYITEAAGHMERLAETEYDVGTVRMTEFHGQPGAMPMRCIYRAIPGLKVERNHYRYATPEGKDLNCYLESPGCDLSVIRMIHRTPDRNSHRRQAQLSYYERRDRELVEA